MHHLAASPNQIEGDELQVIADKLAEIRRRLHGVYEAARDEWRAEKAQMELDLAEAKAERAAPGSDADRERVDTLWSVVSSLAELIRNWEGQRHAIVTGAPT